MNMIPKYSTVQQQQQQQYNSRFIYTCLLVQDAVEAVPLPLDEVEDGLVVLEHQVRHHHTLRRVGGDLALEHVLVEVVVQLLVAVVDAQLLEAVGLEALEAEDVEEGDDGVAAGCSPASAPVLVGPTGLYVRMYVSHAHEEKKVVVLTI